ncbi:hypothetical protein FHL15_005688 [Xylaria flabelliformis]|uniref:Uncharacterized protein n=1 Tax=Xylaria flabelliformis TaxID=2512241 RepID=A0A553HZP1_9PEZI|nr:hypothetical protein FHL15_005688 [Xylaria flabelliformis]
MRPAMNSFVRKGSDGFPKTKRPRQNRGNRCRVFHQKERVSERATLESVSTDNLEINKRDDSAALAKQPYPNILQPNSKMHVLSGLAVRTPWTRQILDLSEIDMWTTSHASARD